MTTTVVHSIGTSGRDYSTIQAWEDACPANLVTADQIWRGECYNDSEFLVAGNVLTVSGTTTDSTRYKWLTAATGQSFQDSVGAQTNALRYNQSNGVGIRSSGAYSAAINGTENYFRLNRLQVSQSGGGNIGGAIASTSNTIFVDGCIAECSASGYYSRTVNAGGSSVVTNTLAVLRAGSGQGFYSEYSNAIFTNCTAVCTSPTSSGTAFASGGGGSSFNLINCAAFGFSTVKSSSGTSTNCYTDNASPPTGWTTVAYDTSTGSGFQNITDATRDFRIKSTSALVNTGTATGAPATDIVGTIRPQGSAYDVGAWEYVASGGGITLTGQSTTVAQGSVGPSITVALTGQSTTVAQGTVSVGTQNITLALTGQSVTVGQGSVSPVLSALITGQSISLAQGTVSPTTSVPVTGQSVTAAQGTLSPATSLPVTGQAATVAQGTLSPILSATLSGQSVALLPGSVTPSTVVGLSGQGVSVGQGTMIVSGADVTVALTGQSVAVQQGLMSVAAAPSASKSGASRQWLIDYYTEAFAKKDKLPDSQGIAKLKTAAARKKAIKAAEIAQEEAIENLVTKAENDLQILTQGIKDSDAAREFTYNLISQAKKHIAAEVDFIAVAEQYQNRIRQENDELLLFAMVL